MCAAIRDNIRNTARKKLGFEELRPGQEEAVQALLQRQDTLVVQPTGSGKSAIYQIAGLLMKGSTVIVSPLLALQKDQIDSIREQDSAEAVALNSIQRNAELRENIKRVEGGEIEYIFLAPEQLRKEETIESLQKAHVSLFVIDEAHCVSEWGHDFRPEYLRIGHAIDQLNHPPVLAMTATASPEVREEIISRLHLRKPKVLVHGFDRPNIYLRVDSFKTEAEKTAELIHRVNWADKPGIVYVGTRKGVERIVKALEAEGISAIPYHAGFPAKDRECTQEQFMNGEADVIVATNAFGMGVDKPDIRFVFHQDAPDSLDAYYQEIGRAGRDGNRAEAALFYRRQDIGAQSFKTGEGKIKPEVLEDVVSRIAEEDEPVRPQDVEAETGLSQRKVSTAIQQLEDAGALESLPTGQIVAVDPGDLPEAAQRALEGQERRQQAKRERLEKMADYAETSACRRELLLRYFGEDFSGPCGFCDNCEKRGKGVGDSDAGTRREVV